MPRNAIEKLEYTMDGLAGRIAQRPICPSCGSRTARVVDSKFPYQLMGCEQCYLQYRYPREDSDRMRRFYQTNYSQSGLTTDLPNDDDLARLLASGFAGTEKDSSRFLRLFEALGIPAGSSIIDFGANWGYHAHQFRNAGFDCTPYEISEPRAAFGAKLDVLVASDWSKIVEKGPYDVAFSSHVLEHTPDPRAAILQQVAVLRPGGWLIAVFPNGADAFREANPVIFHKLWGKVHPVMLTDGFLKGVLDDSALYLGRLDAQPTPDVSGWDQKTTLIGDLRGSELLVVARLPGVDAAATHRT